MARRRQVIDSSDQESDPADQEVSGSDTGSSSGSESGNDLLDMEAHDAPLPGDDSSEVEVDEKFEPFMRLPPELRQKIWESFCPHLASRHGRILSLNFSMEYNVANGPPSAYVWSDDEDDEDEEPVKGPRIRFTVYDGLSLQDHTAGLRLVMAVHGESRQFALKLFPDTIDMRTGSGDAIVRFNRDRDIIMPVCRSQMYRLHEKTLKSISQVKHIAFDWAPDRPEDAVTVLDRGLVGAMPNLETIYLCRHWMSEGFSKSRLRWCASPMVNCHFMETWQKEQLLGEDLVWMMCWPDVKRHPDFTKTHVDPDFFEGFPARCVDQIKKGGVKLLPMVNFEEIGGVDRFYTLVKEHDDGLAADGADSDWSEWDVADEPESEDDYESDGIDDSEHPQVEEADSQDDLLDDGGDSEDDASNGREVVHRPKRRRVVDSDDDDDDDDQEEGKGAPSSGGDKRPAKRNKSNEVMVVVSSDEDEEEEEEEEGASSDDDGSDDENPQPRLSLAERLAQARRDNPIPGEEEEDEDSEDDSDECSYGRGEDEEEDEEDSEDGMVERFAEESEGEGEDGYDEEEEGY
ncbi:hypothetical protein N3K66_004487 [Trichothecium roseum]|uniref:Uncharacterized protein n=1 Tax=Trichothecium roseum TaxID=47278 RepID=A0ACC0V1F4_9HYPO|nr:hypothetical protein N3K66_004487 [Trichothecium roseum]